MGRVLDVLIYGDKDRAERLANRFGKLSIRSRIVRPDSPEPLSRKYWAAGVVLADTREDVATGLKTLEAFATVKIPNVVVSPMALHDDPDVDIWLRDPAPAVQVAARLRAMARLHTMEDVARRRSEVCALYGERRNQPEPLSAAYSILYVGDASPRFMALQHALEGADCEIVAAFSSYSAFDYLHERAFDAVVLNAFDKPDTAFTISSAMRRNARLYHTPVLLLSDTQTTEAVEEAFARGVSDILSSKNTDQEMRDRVLSLAQERRRRREAKAALEACREPRTLDVETGLFHAGFITSHLQDLVNASKSDKFTFSLCLLKTAAPDGKDAPDTASTEKARRQFAAMLRHLLRAEDAAARLDERTFLAVLPYTESDGVDCVAARVAAIADCTAFESEDPLRPFRLHVETAAIESMDEETAEALIERAMRSLRGPAGFAVKG